MLIDPDQLPQIIAIDGPAASGKSTLGQALADKLGYLYFDTGVMYRAATLAALRKNIDTKNERMVTAIAKQIKIDVQPPTTQDDRMYDVLLNGEDITWEIRDREVESAVSPVSAYPGVREAMTNQQRIIGSRGKVVMVGRDIGTVVFPEAELKLYLDASLKARAQRRFSELQSRGEVCSFKQILDDMRRRDRIDSTRKIAPLKPAVDAMIIMTDGMDKVEVLNFALGLINKTRRKYV